MYTNIEMLSWDQRSTCRVLVITKVKVSVWNSQPWLHVFFSLLIFPLAKDFRVHTHDYSYSSGFIFSSGKMCANATCEYRFTLRSVHQEPMYLLPLAWGSVESKFYLTLLHMTCAKNGIPDLYMILRTMPFTAHKKPISTRLALGW